jgi:hypothetical protein
VTANSALRAGWRPYADAVALIACAGAAAWVLAGGQGAFLLSYVDLGFHELGHLLTAWVPGMLPAFAGSTVQVLVPIGLAVYFAARRESYACALMFAWAATSAANVSVYVADGPFETLTLLGGGRHDWAWILGSTGHLGWAPWLASGVRTFAVVLALAGMIVAATSLFAPHARERAEARREEARALREAELRARAPRREPRNRVTTGSGGPGAPPAPAGRF